MRGQGEGRVGEGACEADRVPVIIKLIGDVIDLYECGHIVCRVRAAPAVTCRQGNINPAWKSPSKLGLCLYKFHHNTTGLFQNS